jgi:hypothetical protein
MGLFAVLDDLDQLAHDAQPVLVSLQHRILDQRVQPTRQQQPQLPIGQKVHRKECQQPIPNRDKRPNPHNLPRQIILLGRMSTQTPMEAANE